MLYNYREKEMVIKCSCTEWGEKLVRKFDSKKVREVIVGKRLFDSYELYGNESLRGEMSEEWYASFVFEDGEKITLLQCFSMGYRGEGPWGLHDILINLGVPEKEAEKVFTVQSGHFYMPA